MHFKTIFKSFKNKDMLRRIGIILGLIVAYRLLAHIPVPLGSASSFQELVQNTLGSSDFGSFLNLVSGGSLAKLSIILIGISPFITSSIVFQLLAKAIPSLEELSQDGEAGRRKINQWTRILTVPLAIVQSIAYVLILSQSGSAGTTVDLNSMQLILAVTSMTAGSLILMWVGELITEQGIGNGISMLIFASIISQIPTTFATVGSNLFNTSSGSLSVFGWFDIPVNPTVFWTLAGLIVAIIFILYILIKLNEAQRVITINYAKRVHGNSSYGGIKSILPLKLIAAGVIPVIFATAFLSLPALVGQLLQNAGNDFGTTLVNTFSAPSASNYSTLYPSGLTFQWFIYPILYFLLVIMFTYFYTSISMSTKEIADNLQKQGAFIEHVRPGNRTATYLTRVIRRLNLFGSLSLGLIAMLPFIADLIFILTIGQPLGLSLTGTGLLLIVTIALENLRSLDSRALMVTYDDFKNEA